MRRMTLIALVIILQQQPEVAQAQTQQLQLQTRSYNTAILKAYKPGLVTIEQAAQADQQEAIDRSGEGPMEAPIPLATLLNIRGLSDFGIDLTSIANLSLQVYPDKNQDSGIFYYRPQQYFLHWTPEDQYYLSVDYKPEQASDKNVVIDALLTPGSVQDDVQVLRRLLMVYLRSQPSYSRLDAGIINQLVVLPLPARYEAMFDWRGYGVDSEDISVTGVDPDSRQFGIQIVTDVATKELLLGKLADPSGLSGDVRILPQEVTSAQPALSPFTVRARLKLADNEAYTRAPWRRSGGEFSTFTNDYEFPLRLQHLTYLIEESGALKLRGYDLGGQELLPGDVAKIANEKVTDQIGSSAVVRSWYSYSLRNDEAYRDAIISSLTGGVGAIPVTDVDIQVVRSSELFEQYNMFKIIVVVRSEYFDPNPDSDGMLEKGYEFADDTDRLAVAPLYKPEASTLPLYEYKIGVITNDGSSHQDAEWRQTSTGFGSGIFIGSNQIEEVLAE